MLYAFFFGILSLTKTSISWSNVRGFGCQYRQEPVFLVEIGCPRMVMSGVYSCLSSRRGNVVEETERKGTPLLQAGDGLGGWGWEPQFQLDDDPVVRIIPHSFQPWSE